MQRTLAECRPHSDRGHRPAVDAQLPFPQLRVDPPRPCLCCSAIRCDAEVDFHLDLRYDDSGGRE